MTPQEKAEELVDSYRKEILRGKYHINGFVIEELSQECALLAVNELLNDTKDVVDYHRYWEEVKQQIEAL
jgi:hypothetical protein